MTAMWTGNFMLNRCLKLKRADGTRRYVFAALGWGAFCIVPTPHAMASFDAMLSPPRLELSAKPGDVLRQSVNITNAGSEAATYNIKTADWELETGGRVAYHEAAPRPGSCRPWLKLERRVVHLNAGQTRNFRIEIHVPPDAPGSECRFALLVAGEAAKIAPGATVQIPVVGRMALIGYVSIGGAKPVLQLKGLSMGTEKGKMVVLATIENSGNAHGRLFGSLDVRDAKGRRLELVAEESPIMAKSRSTLHLSIYDWSSGEPVSPVFAPEPPLQVRGKFQFEGGEIKVEQSIR